MFYDDAFNNVIFVFIRHKKAQPTTRAGFLNTT